jgi:hypothetical protein
VAEESANFWELLYDPMGFHLETDEVNDFSLRKFCESIGLPMQSVYDLVRERDDQKGWAIALDPDNAPAGYLPYSAHWVGAVLTPGMSLEQQRLEIKEPTGWKRGQIPSITLIAQRELTGEKWVRIRPRTPGPGQIYIRTLLSETANPARVEMELLEHGVPAWELLDYEAIEAVTVADVATGWETVEEVAEAFPTVKALAHILPDELPE